MSEPSMIDREVRVLHDLARQAAEEAAGESKLAGELTAKGYAIEVEYQSSRRDLEQKHAQGRAQMSRGQIEAERASLKAESETERAKIQAEYEAAVKAYRSKYANESAKAKKNVEEARWQANAVHESGRESAKKHHEQAQRTLANDIQARLVLETEANGLFAGYKKYISASPDATLPAEDVDPAIDPRPLLQASIQTLDAHLTAFHKLRSLKVLRLDSFLFLTVFLILGLGTPAAFLIGWPVGAIAGG